MVPGLVRMRDAERRAWHERLQAVRTHSVRLTAHLSAEDQQLQSMPDASPTKWHLAHTTWFFETMVLVPLAAGYRVFDPAWPYLFNSYYEALGPRHPRPQRGVLSRPSLAEVMAWRAHVDQALSALLAEADGDTLDRALPLIELGLHHEQQHQELILTDILHAFSLQPLRPAVLPDHALIAPDKHDALGTAVDGGWLRVEGGVRRIGHRGEGFAFDNEGPAHDVLLAPFDIAPRPVSCGEYLAFMADGGYREPRWWHSDGWAAVQAGGWEAPACWERDAGRGPGRERGAEDGPWQVFTLWGMRPLALHEPVRHVSWYEASAYAAWAGARLPTEFEWEAAWSADPALRATAGRAWEWTASAYQPYPGFTPAAGAVGEYNGKFMVNQLVLRGGSLATPAGHVRPTYRNFFPAHARWQFSGLRLARGAE